MKPIMGFWRVTALLDLLRATEALGCQIVACDDREIVTEIEIFFANGKDPVRYRADIEAGEWTPA
jgi:hypothetical protein